MRKYVVFMQKCAGKCCIHAEMCR